MAIQPNTPQDPPETHPNLILTLIEIPSLLINTKTHPELPHMTQTQDKIPLLPMMPPHLDMQSPTDASAFIEYVSSSDSYPRLHYLSYPTIWYAIFLPIPIRMLLILPYLPQNEIVPSLRPIFFTFKKKYTQVNPWN